MSENLRKLIGVAVMAAIVVVGVVATSGDDSDSSRTRNAAFGLPKGAGLDAQVQQQGDAELDLTQAIKAAAKCDAGRVLISTGDPLEPWRCGPLLEELATVFDEDRRPRPIARTSGAMSTPNDDQGITDLAPCKGVYSAKLDLLLRHSDSADWVALASSYGVAARAFCIADLAAGATLRDAVSAFEESGFTNSDWEAGLLSNSNQGVRVALRTDQRTGLISEVEVDTSEISMPIR